MEREEDRETGKIENDMEAEEDMETEDRETGNTEVGKTVRQRKTGRHRKAEDSGRYRNGEHRNRERQGVSGRKGNKGRSRKIMRKEKSLLFSFHCPLYLSIIIIPIISAL